MSPVARFAYGMIRISLIIPTYNRSALLARVLTSLAGQTLEPSAWEAVIVNNNSTDNTGKVAGKFIGENPHLNVRLVTERRQGVSYARNRGIEETSGDLIVAIDDDEEMNPGFLEAYLRFFEEYPDAAAAGGKMTPLFDGDPPKWLSPITMRPVAGFPDLGKDVKLMRGGNYPYGGNMGIRRSALRRHGVFRPGLGRSGYVLLGGEEKDLFRRLRKAGEKIYYIPDAEIYHLIPPERWTREYIERISLMIGFSEKIRTREISRLAYVKRLFAEAVKWAATAVISLWYLITLRPAKAGYLFILRWNITLGLSGRKLPETVKAPD